MPCSCSSCVVVAGLIRAFRRSHSYFHCLGASKLALVRRMTSPKESVFEFNPIIPLYQYRHETERGTSWDLFKRAGGNGQSQATDSYQAVLAVSVKTRRCAIHTNCREGNICLRLQTLAHCSRYEAFSGGQSSAQTFRYQPYFASPSRPSHCAILRRVQRQRLEAHGGLAGHPASDRRDGTRP